LLESTAGTTAVLEGMAVGEIVKVALMVKLGLIVGVSVGDW
jgi:hypothetical protein